MMSNESLHSRRGRGRPRKNSNHKTLNNFSNLVKPLNSATKRKGSFETNSEEIQILEAKPVSQGHLKKPKCTNAIIQPKRLQPHRAARFTESYGGVSPDIVIISDDEKSKEIDDASESSSDCTPIPSPKVIEKSKSEEEEWNQMLHSLKKQLSDEEMKLLLLKKLKESQKTNKKDVNPSSSINSQHTPKVLSVPDKKAQYSLYLKSKHFCLPSHNVHLSNNNALLSSNNALLSSSNAHLARSNTHLTSNNALLSSNNNVLENTTPHLASTKFEAPSKKICKEAMPTKDLSNKQIVKPELNINPHLSSSNSKQLELKNSSQFPLLKNLSNQITITPVSSMPLPNTSKQEEKINAEILSQRQAAAKIVLRNELEKTLLQMPLPKPPPLSIKFIPNGNSIEFLYFLGLDVVVDFLTKSKMNISQAKPLSCVQCSTDFTTSWKSKEVKRNGKITYDFYCETCIISNLKKALKAQHTENLKAAFLKALKKEREIDQLTYLSSKTHSLNHFMNTNSIQLLQNDSALPLAKTSANASNVSKTFLNHSSLVQGNKLNPHFPSSLPKQNLVCTKVPFFTNPKSLSSSTSSNPNQEKSIYHNANLRLNIPDVSSSKNPHITVHKS